MNRFRTVTPPRHHADLGNAVLVAFAPAPTCEFMAFLTQRRRLACPVTLWLLPIVLPMLAGQAEAATLQVSVAGIRNNLGMVYVCVFATGEGFPGCDRDAGAIRRIVPASAGLMRFTFDVPPGQRAVSVLHDENGNRKLDTNALGIPREGVGVSNNPAPHWGPPRYAESLFNVEPAGTAITINMVYP